MREKWLLIAGRTNGMHTFNPTDNFPPQRQNRTAYVIDPRTGNVKGRELDDTFSGLEEWQIDLLSVTSPQFLQIKNTLYVTGGYGVNSNTNDFSNKPYLTAIDIPMLMEWIENRKTCYQAVSTMRHLRNSIFQVTGGVMAKISHHPILLLVGQNFIGSYTPSSNGIYTQQIRRFDILDDGKKLDVKIYASKPIGQDPNLRRRDLNIVPILRSNQGELTTELDILSGVFTVDGGIWTVPVRVKANGNYKMRNPMNPNTFKQGMNNYACPTFGVFSQETKDMYTLLFGGISYGYFENGNFLTSESFPFINQITAVKLDRNNDYTHYILKTTYPEILSTRSNPGNPLLFGAGAQLIPTRDFHETTSKSIYVIDECSSKETLTIGYIVGGIASTLPDTSQASDSFASPYIFKVKLKIK